MGKKWKIISNMLKNEFHCSREGLTIGGTEYRPEGDNLPIAIVSHGFMANQKSVRHFLQVWDTLPTALILMAEAL